MVVYNPPKGGVTPGGGGNFFGDWEDVSVPLSMLPVLLQNSPRIAFQVFKGKHFRRRAGRTDNSGYTKSSSFKRDTSGVCSLTKCILKNKR